MAKTTVSYTEQDTVLKEEINLTEIISKSNFTKVVLIEDRKQTTILGVGIGIAVATGTNTVVTKTNEQTIQLTSIAIGTRGLRGESGEPGKPGTIGKPGSTGSPGAKGDTGLQGSKGDKGDTGSQGPTGPGAIMLVQDTKPDELLYLNGQEWLRTTDMVKFTLFVDVDSRQWVQQLNLGSVNLDDSISFETVSKNIRAYNSSFNFTGDILNSIVYTTTGITITKTFNYAGDDLTSIVLSGNTPGGINLTKSFTYSNNNINTINYT